MNRPLDIEVSELARTQTRAAEEWWRVNRLNAPNAIREELERASVLVSVHPEMGARARNISLAGVRRLHLARVGYYVYYRVVTEPERIEVLAFWKAAVAAHRSNHRSRTVADGKASERFFL